MLSKYLVSSLDSIPWPVTWHRYLPGIAHSGRYFEMTGLRQQVVYPEVNLCIWVNATGDEHSS